MDKDDPLTRKNWVEREIDRLDYERRPPRAFLQLDGWFIPESGDYFMRPDAEGDCLTAGNVVDRQRASAEVRVKILIGTDKAIAVRILEKLLNWLKENPFLAGSLNDAVGAELNRKTESSLVPEEPIEGKPIEGKLPF